MTFAEFKQEAEVWYTWTQHHYPFVLALYCLIFIVSGAMIIPVTAFLTVVGGFLFGPIIGGICATICATISSVIIVLSVRYFFGTFILEKYETHLARFNRAIKKHGKWYILTMQIFPFTPTPLMNICVGLTNMPIWIFALATAVGLIPGTFIYSFAGQYLHQVDDLSNIVSWHLLVLLMLGSIIFLMPVLWSYYKNGLNDF